MSNPSPSVNSGRTYRLRIATSANAAVTVTIWDIARLPIIIEAALAAGATDVGGLQFGTSDERDAQDEALRLAIAEARHDAEVIAEAAGGKLGALIEVATPQSSIRQARTMEFSGVGASTPQITPRNIIVMANVNVRWVFVEN